MNYFRNSLLQFMVVLSLLVFMLVGCGSRGEDTPAVDLQPAELVYITDFNNSQTERELLRKFEELHPGITFPTSVYSDWDNPIHAC